MEKMFRIVVIMLAVFGLAFQPAFVVAEEAAKAPAAPAAAAGEVDADLMVEDEMAMDEEDPDITTLKKVVDQLKKDNHPELAAEVETVIENLSW